MNKELHPIGDYDLLPTNHRIVYVEPLNQIFLCSSMAQMFRCNNLIRTIFTYEIIHNNIQTLHFFINTIDLIKNDQSIVFANWWTKSESISLAFRILNVLTIFLFVNVLIIEYIALWLETPTAGKCPKTFTSLFDKYQIKFHQQHT